MRRVVLDTDIGSDVDDALALAVLFGSPEVELVGATTVYGDTLLRAQILSRLARLAGRRVPCVPGARRPLSGRGVWTSGEEGALYPNLDAEPVVSPLGPPHWPHHEDDAARWLAAEVLAAPGQIDVVAIGPLTNLARALRLHPEMADAVRHVWVMGGRFDAGGASAAPEHNLASDAVAAAEVLASGMPITISGLDLTRQVTLDADDVASLDTPGALGSLVAAETRAWMRYWDDPFVVPHDAVTVLTLLCPDLFDITTSAVTVHPGPDPAHSGRCTTAPCAPEAPGAVRVVTAVEVHEVHHEMLARLHAAIRLGAAAPGVHSSAGA